MFFRLQTIQRTSNRSNGRQANFPKLPEQSFRRHLGCNERQSQRHIKGQNYEPEVSRIVQLS